MPELPDVVVYQESLQRHFEGRVLQRIDLKSPFVVRTFDPDLFDATGKRIVAINRIGKRLVWKFDGELLMVFHLMIAGRFHLRKPGARPRSKTDLAAFHFATDNQSPIEKTLMFTEASPKKRASIHTLASETALVQFDRGGIDVLTASPALFRQRLTAENHTLKRSLTDPRLFDGIGNAYSDEILHAARLSPIKWTSRLSDDEIVRLHTACQETLTTWIERLRAQVGGEFPERVTAFRPEMAVHGKFGQACPECQSAGLATKVHRIRYADNETNYCPRCQTGGKILADRSLSRLLKGDWPKTIEELEETE